MIGMAAMAAGSAVQARRQSKDAKRAAEAGNASRTENFERQGVLQGEAAGIFDESLGIVDPNRQAGKRAGAEVNRNAVSDRAISSSVPGLSAVSSSAPSIVGDTMSRVSGETNTESRARGGRSAKITKLGDVLLGNQFELQPNSRRLDDVSSFSRGVANLLPLQVRTAAQNAVKGPSQFGQLLQLGGQALSTGAGLSSPGTGVPAVGSPGSVTPAVDPSLFSF